MLQKYKVFQKKVFEKRIFEKRLNKIFQKMKLLLIFGAVLLAAPTLALQQSDGSFC